MCRVFAEVCNVCSTPCIQGKAILFTCLDIHTIQMFQESVEPELQDGMHCKNFRYGGRIYISQGKSIGLRIIPTLSDLRFAYEEKQQQKLDEQAQKVRASGQNALMSWAQSCGEASDYRDNLPLQCLHPVGHYFEVPNMILSGTLKKMLDDRPQLQYLLLHNIDTVGADVDAGLLGMFADSNTTLSVCCR